MTSRAVASSFLPAASPEPSTVMTRETEAPKASHRASSSRDFLRSSRILCIMRFFSNSTVTRSPSKRMKRMDWRGSLMVGFSSVSRLTASRYAWGGVSAGVGLGFEGLGASSGSDFCAGRLWDREGAAGTPFSMSFSTRLSRSVTAASGSFSGWQARTAASSSTVRGLDAQRVSGSARMNSSSMRSTAAASVRSACARKRSASSGVTSRMSSRPSFTAPASITARRWAAVSRMNTWGSPPRRVTASIC